MYDKVKIWIDRTTMQGITPNQIAMLLDNAKEQTNLDTGEVQTFGYLDALKVSVYVGGVSVVGSMPKYLYGNNIYPLDRHTTAEAFEKLGDAMHLDLTEAQVTGLEFGTTYLMKHPVKDYLQRLGDISKLVRCPLTASTLYYKHKGKQQPKTLCFYDKGAEEQAKGLTLPTGLQDANLLRYELRYNGKLAHQIGCPVVNASTLSTPAFYRLLVEKYQYFYNSIIKLNQVKTNIMDEIKTVNDAFEVFVARLICQSNQSTITGFLDELKDAQVFADRKCYTRLKNKIQDISTKASVTVTDELIRELNDEIKNVGAYV